MSTYMGTAPQTKPSKTQTLNKFGDPYLQQEIDVDRMRDDVKTEALAAGEHS